MELAVQDAKGANEQVNALYHMVFLPFESLLDEQITEAGKRARQADDEASRTGEHVYRSVIAVVVVCLMLVIGWTPALSRSIQCALENIQTTLQEASNWLDLSRRVPIQNMDEIGHTATAFNHLMSRIGEVMDTVQDSAESVSVTSKQIAEGNIDLSSRTEERAASLKQTAASMEELTGTVRKTECRECAAGKRTGGQHIGDRGARQPGGRIHRR